MDRDIEFAKLLEVIEKERQRFSDRHIPLSEKQIKAVKGFSDYVADDRTSRRDYYGKRAQVILRDIWKHIPYVFILCALVTYPTKLANLDSPTAGGDCTHGGKA